MGKACLQMQMSFRIYSLSSDDTTQTKACSVDLNVPGVCTPVQAGLFMYYKNILQFATSIKAVLDHKLM